MIRGSCSVKPVNQRGMSLNHAAKAHGRWCVRARGDESHKARDRQCHGRDGTHSVARTVDSAGARVYFQSNATRRTIGRGLREAGSGC